MKLNIDERRSQGDPYVISENGKYYMYATHSEGVQLYESDNKYDWRFVGFCFRKEGVKEYWAPAVTKIEGKFYLYASYMGETETDTHRQRLFVGVADAPYGPFEFIREIAEPFSIDPHVVISGNGLYIFYSVNDYEAERAGTLIVVDKMLSPTECAGNPKVVVRATLDEEIFKRDRFRVGQHWHTLEGAFYFREGDYHYLTYSGNCFQNENYYLGYAVAKGNTDDLTRLQFKKYPDENTYCPLVRKNDVEEGTGHNSVLKENGIYYLFYHGRDYGVNRKGNDLRTARVLEFVAKDGRLEVVKR